MSLLKKFKCKTDVCYYTPDYTYYVSSNNQQEEGEVGVCVSVCVCAALQHIVMVR